MKQAVSVFMIISYIIASAFLESDEGGRLVFADILLLAIIILSIPSIVTRPGQTFASIHTAALPLLIALTASCATALYLDRSLIELAALVFGFTGSLAIVNFVFGLDEVWLARFLRLYVTGIGLLAAVCLIDFFFLPGLISSRSLGGLQGPFRNTGQAGSFFGVHFTLCLALLVSGLIPRNITNVLLTAAVGMAVLFTFKRSSTMGLAVGLGLLLLTLYQSRNNRLRLYASRTTVGLILGGGLAYLTLLWAIDAVAGVSWRFTYKFSDTAIEDFTEGFAAQNIASALAALTDSPLFGVGLDNVRDVYQHHEIHSTYLGILAYGGVVGLLAYSFFMLAILRSLLQFRHHSEQNPWAQFLTALFPLFVGLMVSWAYTYHIRKREFWLMVTFIVIASAFAQRTQYLRRQDPNAEHAARLSLS